MKALNPSPLKRYLIVLLVLAMNISCDQISKNMVRDNLIYNERVDLIDHHLVLTKVENTGAFLSLGSDLSPWLKTILLWGLPALALGIMLPFILFNKKINLQQAVAFACVIGGGIGNIFDRIAFGSVTDFLIIDFGFAKTGVFNAADMSIMIGAAFLLLSEFVKRKPEI